MQVPLFASRKVTYDHEVVSQGSQVGIQAVEVRTVRQLSGDGSVRVVLVATMDLLGQLFNTTVPHLDERQCRLAIGAEATTTSTQDEARNRVRVRSVLSRPGGPGPGLTGRNHTKEIMGEDRAAAARPDAEPKVGGGVITGR
ncbi:hypothetical protein [Streptomyces sp. NPDC102283]|uniref:hypothetical protein n=1 Tax=Streptomyces sp. NPDC102283 TaxID=3366155 RepID=UPI003809150B